MPASQSPTLSTLPLDISAPAFKADPGPVCAAMRAEHPVARIAVAIGASGAAYLVNRYEDALIVLRDERFVKDVRHARPLDDLKLPWTPNALKPLSHTLLDADGEEHRRLRNLVRDAFAPNYVAQLEPRVQHITDDLLSRMAARSSADLVADFALPLPLTVIGEILGVPEGDRMRFRGWVDSMLGVTASSRPTLRMLLKLPNILAMIGFVRRLIADHRAHPREDLIGRLVAVQEDGDRLTDDELLAMVLVLLIAGYETTVNLIATGALLLLRHPDQLARLRQDPQLIGPAVEELLRLGTPVDVATERYAREDVDIAGVSIPRGALVLVNIQSANTDEQRFPHAAGSVDVTRTDNHHLSFGQGAHYCLGAPLARMEGRVALSALIRRFPELSVAVPVDSLRWRRGVSLRSLVKLPVNLSLLEKPRQRRSLIPR
jgi:cytochrome P450